MGTGNVDVSRDVYVWCHFAVILVHLGMAAGLIYIYFSKLEARSIRLVCLIIGSVLTIVSILAMIPIFVDYDDIRDLLILKN